MEAIGPELRQHIVTNNDEERPFSREAMLAIRCIQAQRCHTGDCPAGIATQNRWLMGGLDPTDKANRFANYVVTMRKDLLQLGRACGVPHPCEVELKHFEILNDAFGTQSAEKLFGYPIA
ncbi:hypothetical protein Mal15_20470 [Stieleria maiorica]|uniref:Glutamate synthase domain-containing protein n=1 Tax=Stieleria maiorica TaxID=2795974 RepID=A0A5B9M9N5_9BACT|nr:glutamate synthase-related protein [Stieleria maiorica]QEF98001.1 hypothetical protein Mal15_20470 [Stieleria maiorica]